MARVSDPERARRMARVLVSDIVAYAGDEVRIGLEKDDLFERLAPDLERARTYFLENVDRSRLDAARIFNHAVVDVLVAGQRKVSTSIW